MMFFYLNKQFLISIPLSFLMARSSSQDPDTTSSSDGALTLATPMTGHVARSAQVHYTLPVSIGTIYELTLMETSNLSRPAIIICEELDCPSGSDSVQFVNYAGYDGTELAWYSVTTASTLHIYIEGTNGPAKYTINVREAPNSAGGQINPADINYTYGTAYQGQTVQYTLPATAGRSYEFALNIGQGKADYLVCTDLYCNTTVGQYPTPQPREIRG